MGGMGRQRGGPIPPSKIPGENPFRVLDNLRCGCTHLPGAHLSLGAAPNFGGCACLSGCLRCTYLGGCTHLLGCAHHPGCTHLQGLHPSPGVHPSPGHEPVSQVCTHPWGLHPSPGIGGCLGYGAGLGGDAQAAAQSIPGGVPASPHTTPWASLAPGAAVPASPPPAAARRGAGIGCSPAGESLALDGLFLAAALTIPRWEMVFITPAN